MPDIISYQLIQLIWTYLVWNFAYCWSWNVEEVATYIVINLSSFSGFPFLFDKCQQQENRIFHLRSVFRGCAGVLLVSWQIHWVGEPAHRTCAPGLGVWLSSKTHTFCLLGRRPMLKPWHHEGKRNDNSGKIVQDFRVLFLHVTDPGLDPLYPTGPPKCRTRRNLWIQPGVDG